MDVLICQYLMGLVEIITSFSIILLTNNPTRKALRESRAPQRLTTFSNKLMKVKVIFLDPPRSSRSTRKCVDIILGHAPTPTQNFMEIGSWIFYSIKLHQIEHTHRFQCLKYVRFMIIPWETVKILKSPISHCLRKWNKKILDLPSDAEPHQNSKTSKIVSFSSVQLIWAITLVERTKEKRD